MPLTGLAFATHSNAVDDGQVVAAEAGFDSVGKLSQRALYAINS